MVKYYKTEDELNKEKDIIISFSEKIIKNIDKILNLMGDCLSYQEACILLGISKVDSGNFIVFGLMQSINCDYVNDSVVVSCLNRILGQVIDVQRNIRLGLIYYADKKKTGQWMAIDKLMDFYLEREPLAAYINHKSFIKNGPIVSERELANLLNADCTYYETDYVRPEDFDFDYNMVDELKMFIGQVASSGFNHINQSDLKLLELYLRYVYDDDDGGDLDLDELKSFL